jgi:membrane protein DedA with SNARE-associated domain
MKPVIDFIQGLRKLPIIIQLWLMILGMSNMMFPLFYISHVEAQVMFIATVLSFAIFLMNNFSNIGFDDPFGIWMGVALLLTSISLIFDIVDTIRYIAGNRESLI